MIDFKKLFEKLKTIKISDRRIILVVIIVILVLLMMDFNNRMVVLLRLNQQRDQLSTQVVELEQTKAKFDEQVAYATSERALEEWAREKARLVKEGDVPIIILPPAQQKISPTPVPTPAIKTVSRWEVWQALFFGD